MSCSDTNVDRCWTILSEPPLRIIGHIKRRTISSWAQWVKLLLLYQTVFPTVTSSFQHLSWFYSTRTTPRLFSPFDKVKPFGLDVQVPFHTRVDARATFLRARTGLQDKTDTQSNITNNTDNYQFDSGNFKFNNDKNNRKIKEKSSTNSNHKRNAHVYASYWEHLLELEHQETIQSLREKRNQWSRQRLEESGLCILDAAAQPDSEVLGEKIVRISKDEDADEVRGKDIRWRDVFSRGDVFIFTPKPNFPTGLFKMGKKSMRNFKKFKPQSKIIPRECTVVDVGKDWMTVAVGPTWPVGLWESRRQSHIGSYRVCLDRCAPLTPLKAQKVALQMTRMGRAGEVADWLAQSFQVPSSFLLKASGQNEHKQLQTQAQLNGKKTQESNKELFQNMQLPRRTPKQIQQALCQAMQATNSTFIPNCSQKEAIVWALGRRVSLIRGPPGTGKTMTTAMLVSTALNLPPLPSKKKATSSTDTPKSKSRKQNDKKREEFVPPPRVLAVAHSNPAADVLLQALLQCNVPAIRLGRPATVSPSVQHRTVTAMAHRHPEMVALRQQRKEALAAVSGSVGNETDGRTISTKASKRIQEEVMGEICHALVKTAPVVVASCIGAHQLLQQLGGGDFGEASSSSQSRNNKSDVQSRQQEKEEEPLFSLVVLDEAAQTTEPALLCALASARASQVVMVGDTQQLPPTVTSERAELRHALGVSPMARLEASCLFMEDEGNGEEGGGTRTLRVQYRMPPALLEYPSQYFYNGLVTTIHRGGDVGNDQQQPRQDSAATQVSLAPPPPPSPPAGFPWPRGEGNGEVLPLAFIHTGDKQGEVLHEFGGRSNPKEARLIATIVANVLGAGEMSASDVAVITPYAKQVQLLREELRLVMQQHESCQGNLTMGQYSNNQKKNRNKRLDVRVGTVDSFQGQETDLVLFSAVRSNPMAEMGFLRDARRLCVAVTRARRGLILVGDGNVLVTSKPWRALINSCRARGCWMEEQELLQSDKVSDVYVPR